MVEIVNLARNRLSMPHKKSCDAKRLTLDTFAEFYEDEIPLLNSLPSKVEDFLNVDFRTPAGHKSSFKRALVAVRSGHLVLRGVARRRSRWLSKKVTKVSHNLVHVLALRDCQLDKEQNERDEMFITISNKAGESVCIELKTTSQKQRWLRILRSEMTGFCKVEVIEKLKTFYMGKILGHGHFGSVQLLYKKNSECSLALKTLNITKIVSSVSKYNIRERVIMEKINILKDSDNSMNFESLPRLYSSFAIKGSLYLVMEAFRSGSLLDLLKAKKKLPESAVMYIVYEFLRGLQGLHSIDIGHRDIKLENIMLDSSGKVKIIDFGLAREFIVMSGHDGIENTLGDRRKSYSHELEFEKRYVKAFDVVGTSYYQAPEMLKGKGHDLSVDFWQVGCLMFELLYGYPLFYAKLEEDVEDSIISSDEIKFPSSNHFGLISSDALDFMEHLLIREPSDRLGFNGGCSALFAHRLFSGYMHYPPQVPDVILDYVKLAKEENASSTDESTFTFYDFCLSKGVDMDCSRESEVSVSRKRRSWFPWRKTNKVFSTVATNVERKEFLQRLGVNYVYYKVPLED